MKHLLSSIAFSMLFLVTYFVNAQNWRFYEASAFLPNTAEIKDLTGFGDSLLIATNLGLVIKEGNNSTTLNQNSGLAEDDILSLAVGANGNLLCLHSNHITYVANGVTSIYTLGIDYNYAGEEVVHSNGWYYIDEYLAFDGLSFNTIQPNSVVFSVFSGPENTLYFSSMHKAYEVESGQIIDSITYNGVFAEVVGNGHTAYSIGEDSVYQFNGINWVAICAKEYRSMDYAYTDQLGQLWTLDENYIVRGTDSAEITLPYAFNHGFALSIDHPLAEYDNKIVALVKDGWVEAPLDVDFNATKLLEVNNLKIKVNPDGSLGNLNDPSVEQCVAFEETMFIFSGNIWMSGIEASSQEHMASGEIYSGYYNYEDHYRFSSGPYATVFHQDRNYRTYRVTALEIQNHIANNGSLGYSMPTDIKNWPAHGNSSRGEAVCLAPFVDVDGDGDYHPENGDYPQIRGDKAVYTIFNDAYSRNYTNEAPMGIEGHMMVYGFENENSAIDNTFFVNYRLVNRGGNDYENFRVGEFIDFDLGNPNDDFIGCDSSLNLFYVYNGDDNDEDNSGATGFGNAPPAAGVVLLSDQLKHFRYYNISAGNTGPPESTEDYYNYMNGMWKDGSHMVYGGNGYSGASNATTISSEYMFSGDPVTQTGWTEASLGNTPNDRRGVGVGEGRNFSAGDTIEFEFAVMLAKNTSSSAAGAITDLRNQTAAVTQWFGSQSFDAWNAVCSGKTVGVKETAEEINPLSVKVYPNPTQSSFTVAGLEEQAEMSVYALDGSLMVQQRITSGQTLDVKQLPSGIYIIRLVENNRQKNLRLVVQE